MTDDSTATALPGGRIGRRIGELLESVEKAITSGLLVAVFVLVFGQVVARYALSSPPFWIEEIARMGMVWLTFLAAAYVTGKGLHLVMTMITDKLGKTASVVFTYIGEVIILITSLALIPASWHLVSTLSGVASSSGLVTRGVLFIAPLLGFGLMAVHSIINILWKKPVENTGEVAI